MTDFKTIPLSEIHPDKNQPRKFFGESALKELTESVKSKGVLQPVMVRPNGKGYILVCGERRLKASIAAGLVDIPAVIRTLTDQEALEIQFIENIQRDDVHPMDEATTFKSMLENKVKAYTIADIAAKINKPETFVVHRLSLNSLIPELQKDFWSGKFLIGHAVLFSKLSQEDQKVCMKECKEHVFSGNSKSVQQYESIQEVKSFIERNIMRVLSAAPFKKDDPTLNPAMGACTTCPFRSGNNPSLFDDIKETDRCFKPSCFDKKIETHLVRAVKETLEGEPDTVFLKSSGYNDEKVNNEVTKLLQSYKITPLRSYHDFSVHISKGDQKIKGIWINGDKAGQIQHVALPSKGKATRQEKTKDGRPTPNAIDEEIDGIKQRTKRAAELDDEKVWLRIHKEVIRDEKEGLLLENSKQLSPIDTAALLMAMYEKTGPDHSDDIIKLFGFKGTYLYGDDKKKFAAKLLSVTPEQFNQVSRYFFLSVLDSPTGSHTSSGGLGLLKQVAEQYHKDKIATMELEQQEKQTKREERSAARIKGLQEQKKQIAVKPVAAAGKTKKSKKK